MEEIKGIGGRVQPRKNGRCVSDLGEKEKYKTQAEELRDANGLHRLSVLGGRGPRENEGSGAWPGLGKGSQALLCYGLTRRPKYKKIAQQR